jgi:hypothetical protein
MRRRTCQGHSARDKAIVDDALKGEVIEQEIRQNCNIGEIKEIRSRESDACFIR